MKSKTYEEFVEKFKPKKTTDDCYTPEPVYNVIAKWVCEEYDVNSNNFVRPFYPEGDYENYPYKDTDIVVDNPPFSILAKIVNFYIEHNIKFFLFSPATTLFSPARSKECCCIGAGVDITYENGAVVRTSFLTNLEEAGVRSAPKLYRMIHEAVKGNKKDRSMPKYNYPKELITAMQVVYMSHHDIDFKADASELYFIRELDAQKEFNKTIFGAGFLTSRGVAERKRVVPDKIDGVNWQLSERELGIIQELSKNENKNNRTVA